MAEERRRGLTKRKKGWREKIIKRISHENGDVKCNEMIKEFRKKKDLLMWAHLCKPFLCSNGRASLYFMPPTFGVRRKLTLPGKFLNLKDLFSHKIKNMSPPSIKKAFRWKKNPYLLFHSITQTKPYTQFFFLHLLCGEDRHIKRMNKKAIL